MYQIGKILLIALSLFFSINYGYCLPTSIIQPISGSNTVCAGSAITLSDSTNSGIWSSSNAAIATIDTVLGILTGVNSGIDTISYTVSGNSVNYIITVNPQPNAGTITGTGTTCIGTSTTLTDGIGLGIWSSANTSVASVNAIGVITGVIAGTATISFSTFNSCGIAAATTIVTINTIPSAGGISGANTVCTGSTITLTDGIGAGIWSSTNTSIASVNSTGVVTGVAAGSVTLSYSTVNSCGTNAATVTITVSPLPTVGSIIGTLNVCAGGSTSLSDAISGGSWSSSNISIATVSSSGVVTGVEAGITTISYTDSNTCGSISTTTTLTVNPLPNAGSIVGANTICAGSLTTLTDAVGAGIWSSTNTAIATISGTGVVSGLASGIATISFSTFNICGIASTTSIISVNPLPTVSGIIGMDSVCTGASISLNDLSIGGTWTSNNTSIASVSNIGLVSGVSTGISTISYTITNSCGSIAATALITVNPLPGAGSISGLNLVCAGSTLSLSDLAIGGTWSSSNSSIATVNNSGSVSGLIAGNTTISYTINNSCGTAVATTNITVNPLPIAGSISGIGSVCMGSTDTLTDLTTGGAWSSINTAIATISSTGIVSGIGVGTSLISYTVNNSCGTIATTTTITVNPLPFAGTISGINTFCAGTSTLLTDGASGGVWSSSNTLKATVDGIGNVLGISGGNATISYSLTNSCGIAIVTKNITINPLPDTGFITGPSLVCDSSTVSYSDSITGGTFSTTNSHALQISGGTFYGYSAGLDTIKYTLTNSCGTIAAHKPITINMLPHAGVISGIDAVCQGAVITLTDGASSGSWSASNSHATISGGFVTGVTTGIDSIIYNVTNYCGTDITYKIITVNPLPNSGSITGISVLCVSATSSLSNSATSGTWSASNSNATVVAGLVAGVAAGIDSINYTVSNSCGTSISSVIVTINPLPFAGSISGVNTLCVGSTDSLTNYATTGTWSETSGNTAVTLGRVVGLTPGTDIIKYKVINSCGVDSALYTVTINPLPYAGNITGVDTLCQLTNVTLTDSISGGVWSATNNLVTLSAITGGNIVNGVNSGIDTISYSLTNSCGTAITNFTVTINPQPHVGIITGLDAVCVGSTITLIDTVAGGNWNTSLLTSNASVSNGVITGISAGLSLISYSINNSCSTAIATKIISIHPLPNSGIISGPNSVCVGSAITLSDTSIGSWSVTNAKATISGGILFGLSTGIDTVNYTVSNICGTSIVSKIITINALPTVSAISGAGEVCTGNQITLSDATSGGSWNLTNSTATSSGNIIFGVVQGVDTAIYSVTNSCGTVSSSSIITINPLPNAGFISGANTICNGLLDTFSTTIAGGTWNSSNSSIANFTSAGILTTSSVGIDTIYYVITNNCGSASASKIITVFPTPNAGTITGSNLVCTGMNTTLSDSALGGIWISINSHASVSGGIVTGNTSGIDTITYSLTNISGCSANTTSIITVNSSPTVNPIIGSTIICAGSPITLSDASLGGSWNSTNPSIASVFLGIISTFSAGIDTIQYSLSNTYCTTIVSKIITINPLPDAGIISGSAVVCQGATISLSESKIGGNWKSLDTNKAIVTSSGVVSGVNSGNTFISYKISNSCGSDSVSFPLTINPLPISGIILGLDSICQGSNNSLSETSSSGIWSTTNTYATISTSGIVTGNIMGIDTILYIVTNSCGTSVASKSITIHPLPIAGTISGSGNICLGSIDTLTNNSSFYVSSNIWSCSNTNASITSTGVLTGITSGTDTISFTVSNSCGNVITTKIITLNSSPIVGSISGFSSICVGAIQIYTDSVISGTWNTSNNNALISSLGVLTGVTTGLDTISYSITNACASATVTKIVTINPLPNAGTIIGNDTLCLGTTTTLSATITSGLWAATNTHASISSGIVNALSVGTDSIYYSINNICGMDSTIKIIHVITLPDTISITGNTHVCFNNYDTLTPSVGGGNWNLTNHTIILNLGGGAFYGHFSGMDTVEYTLTNICGSSTTLKTLIVDTSVSMSSIFGLPTICVGSTDTLNDSTLGGIWQSSNPLIATVDYGIVTGLTSGIDTLIYTKTNACGGTSAIKIITVLSTPVAGSIITTDSMVCQKATLTFTDSITSGIWSASDSNATINSFGMVTGRYPGIDTIKYTVTNICGSTSIFQVITINPLPYAGVISGIDTICINTYTLLTDTTYSYGPHWWTITNPLDSVNSNGLFFGRTAGVDTLEYIVFNPTICGVLDTAFYLVYTRPSPVVSSILGNTNLCLGVVSSYTDSTNGGTWFSSNNSIATIDSITGVVSPIHLGTTNIMYTVTNICGFNSAIYSITVNPIPDTIIGTSNLCANSTSTLSDSSLSGTWMSSDTTIAKINSSGLVMSKAITHLDSTIITYQLPTSCIVHKTILVHPKPQNVTIIGKNMICLHANDTLSDFTYLYATSSSWVNSDTTLASLNTLGYGGITAVIQSKKAGTDTIYNIMSNTCGTDTARLLLKIRPLPYVSPIMGTSAICSSTPFSLSDSTIGGTWHSTTIDSISSGLYIGFTTGINTISYTFVDTFGCDSTATKNINILSIPILSTITGLDSVCAGAYLTLGEAYIGGIWSSNHTNASVSSSGIVSGISVGIDTIIYTATNTCGTSFTTKTIYIHTIPNSGTISGIPHVCIGTPDTLFETASGGVWSNHPTAVATISSTSGIIHSLMAGIDTINYTIHNTCGNANTSYIITVNTHPNAGTIHFASDSVCIGTHIALLDTNNIGGIGNWIHNSLHDSISGAMGIATLTGLAIGIDTIKYNITNFCGSSSTAPIIVHILPLPNAGIISAPNTLCLSGTESILDTIVGGLWNITNNNIVIDTIANSGTIHALSIGLDTLTYEVTNICGTHIATKIITVNPDPNSGIILGKDSICVGSTITLTDSISGGTWTSSNTNCNVTFFDTLSTQGIISGLNYGLDTILYTISNSCGSATSKFFMDIDTTVTPHISGLNYVCLPPHSDQDTLNATPLGGLWFYTNTHALVDPSGIIFGASPGKDTIIYTFVNHCGAKTDTFPIYIYTGHQCDSVNAVPIVENIVDGIKVYPNPASDNFTVAVSNLGHTINVILMDMYGKISIEKQYIDYSSKIINIPIKNITPGNYIIQVIIDEKIYREQLVILYNK